ncbi:hypothetical protein QTP70_032174 [Hemibagrus guttatus]|uniref:DUF4515 domain-containing protein n=1 Tax=Hemibagrus guttatus TaxID=175788 RepID=A0AAE0R9N0_9TELE|nr:hypothetical protein QTP70_032174 [Hemibagrus guttatus]KAK3568035.1 hypothetical protein QTP86_029111 [Hemibagrus guttatus]
MAPKKKKKSKASGGSEKEKDSERDAEKEAQLHREHDTLTDTLSNLKRRAGQLMQNASLRLAKIQQEFTSYMSKRTQKHCNEIVTLNDLRQQKLEALNKQREEMVEKHNEQVNGLKKEIFEKEKELALLNLEIYEKSLQQQQLDRITELEQEVTSAYFHQSETLNALKANSFIEKERHKAACKHTVWELTLKAKKEASTSLLSYIQQVSEENHHLHEELQQLIQRARALRNHQQLLQMKRRQLLLEKEYVQELQCLRTSTAQVGCFQLTDHGILNNNTTTL